ncbi:MAG: hypothetical protein ACRDJW_07970 [Thermomicrobiales bacterium]
MTSRFVIGYVLPFLAVTTIGCCAFTLFLGEGGLIWSLAWFVVANIFFQPGLIFYDALLPTVSTEQNRGWVSGLGIGSKRTLNRLLVLWGVALSLAAVSSAANLPSAAFWLIAPLVGIAVGGTATTNRPYLMRASPQPTPSASVTASRPWSAAFPPSPARCSGPGSSIGSAGVGRWRWRAWW